MNDLKIKKKTTSQWHDYIGTSLRKTAEATLDTAKRVSEYRMSVEEDEFNQSMKEWFGFSPSHLSYWGKIAENLPRFQENTRVLPASPRTLYELSGIDDALWDELVQTGDVNPSVTVEGAKSLKITGGFKKATARKYGEADNFLDIMQELDAIMATTESIKEVKYKMKEYLKKHPAEYEEAEPTEEEMAAVAEMEGEEYVPTEEEMAAVVAEMEGEESEHPKESQTKDKVVSTSSQVRVKCLAAFGIYVDKPIVDEDLLRLLDRKAGNNESLLAMIATLESE